MLATVGNIVKYIEEMAPISLACQGDNSGLQVGDPGETVATVLVTLEMDGQVFEEAAGLGARMVVTHHPLIYRPLRGIDERNPLGALMAKLIRSKINVYSAHTNLDLLPEWVSGALADLIGVEKSGREVIESTSVDQLLKLVVFVPAGHEDSLRQALAEAGAGWIGNYSHCTFQASGIGTFMPGGNTNPFIGEQGRLEKVEELRLETILPASLRDKVLRALLETHPYEEAAYDLYPLCQGGERLGFGLLGRLDPPLGLEELVERCRERLSLPALSYWAPPGKAGYSRVAVCGGSGGRLVEQAFAKGAQIFISGDFGYHDLLCAAGHGLALIDAGHFFTERPVLTRLTDYLRQRLAADGYRTTVITANSAPGAIWNFSQG